jgi:hypothetical protein
MNIENSQTKNKKTVQSNTLVRVTQDYKEMTTI